MNENQIENKKVSLRIQKIFLNPKQWNVYYFFLIGMVVLLLIINIAWFLWLSGGQEFIKDLPGVENSFFNGFTNKEIDISQKVTFSPSKMIFAFQDGITTWSILIISLILLVLSVAWPAILSYFYVIGFSRQNNSLFFSFRRSLIPFYTLIPAIIFLIAQNFIIIQSETFTSSFESQFFNQFTDFSEANWTQEIKTQFEIAKTGAIEIFDSNGNKIFSIISTVFSILLILMILFYSSFAAFHKFGEDSKQE
ncbi:hypothetical protein [Spiroplasma alleghenense]|uniref:Uncharacterized protein n=1 Tax=Spiroplasma alleghenense TaxID=216931 RepID=A0A345Z4P2_9MOLU|nr:hypothetical protein [Spiroplasma alleghenense]AXK51571.1 hypothetical protein SALLE_v1c09010 [Spiroplasma alleghenense]